MPGRPFQRMLIVVRAKNKKWVHIDDKQPIKILSDSANLSCGRSSKHDLMNAMDS